jgi:hypothetical protein
MSSYSTTGQIVSPASFAASISATRAATRPSMTANTSSMLRPEAAIRALSAALIVRMAVLRSVGVVSQCGRAGNLPELLSTFTVMLGLFSVRTPYLLR